MVSRCVFIQNPVNLDTGALIRNIMIFVCCVEEHSYESPALRPYIESLFYRAVSTNNSSKWIFPLTLFHFLLVVCISNTNYKIIKIYRYLCVVWMGTPSGDKSYNGVSDI